MIDDYARECLAFVVATSLARSRVARELDHMIALSGKPQAVVSDDGTELTSSAILRPWQGRSEWHYMPQAMQNGFVESSNDRLGDECLNETVFASLPHASWKHYQ